MYFLNARLGLERLECIQLNADRASITQSLPTLLPPPLRLPAVGLSSAVRHNRTTGRTTGSPQEQLQSHRCAFRRERHPGSPPDQLLSHPCTVRHDRHPDSPRNHLSLRQPSVEHDPHTDSHPEQLLLHRCAVRHDRYPGSPQDHLPLQQYPVGNDSLTDDAPDQQMLQRSAACQSEGAACQQYLMNPQLIVFKKRDCSSTSNAAWDAAVDVVAEEASLEEHQADTHIPTPTFNQG